MYAIRSYYGTSTGISEARFLAAQSYCDVLPPTYCAQCLASDAAALRTEGIVVTHEQMCFADGSIHDLRVIKAVKRDEHGSYNFV